MHHLSTAFQNFNGIQIDNAEDLDVVMPMYNLLEYSKIKKKQQVVCGIITEMNQAILFLLQPWS